MGYKQYCKEPEKIENFEKAKVDDFVGWHCHHRLQTWTSDGKRRAVDITAAELIALGMYYNRPADELIFLTESEHNSLHQKEILIILVNLILKSQELKCLKHIKENKLVKITQCMENIIQKKPKIKCQKHIKEKVYQKNIKRNLVKLIKVDSSQKKLDINLA